MKDKKNVQDKICGGGRIILQLPLKINVELEKKVTATGFEPIATYFVERTLKLAN